MLSVLLLFASTAVAQQSLFACVTQHLGVISISNATAPCAGRKFSWFVDGAPGPEGPRGQTGERGEQGRTGRAGHIGATGPIGPTGPIGSTGPIGASGRAGNRGRRCVWPDRSDVRPAMSVRSVRPALPVRLVQRV
jgi:hypothetical protein